MNMPVLKVQKNNCMKQRTSSVVIKSQCRMPCIQVLCPTTTAGASATKLYFNFYVDLFHMLGFKRDGEPPPL